MFVSVAMHSKTTLYSTVISAWRMRISLQNACHVMVSGDNAGHCELSLTRQFQVFNEAVRMACLIKNWLGSFEKRSTNVILVTSFQRSAGSYVYCYFRGFLHLTEGGILIQLTSKWNVLGTFLRCLIIRKYKEGHCACCLRLQTMC